MDKDHVIDNILGDWLGSISYMSAKVAIKPPQSSGGWSKHKGDTRIYKFDLKRGCDGYIGIYHRKGCGSRRGHHYISNRHEPANG